jgi:hypothetical protein
VKRFAFIVLFAGFPLRVSKMERSAAPNPIQNILSLCYVLPDEKVYASTAEGERIGGFREALHLLDEKLLEEREV